MELSAVSRFIPQNSKEPDVIEIAPPLSDRTARMKAKGKQKEVAYHQVIDVDGDEDHDDVVLLEGDLASVRKARRSKGISLGPISPAKLDSNEVESNKKGKEVTIDPTHPSNGFNSGSNNFFDLDDYVFDDDFLAFPSYFNEIGAPAGVKTPFPNMPDLVHMQKGIPSIPYVTSNAQLEASASQPNKGDSFSASNWVPPSNYLSNSSSFPHLEMDSTYHLGVDTTTSKWHESGMKNHGELDETLSKFGMLSETDGIHSTMDDLLSGQDTATNDRGLKRSRSVKSTLNDTSLGQDNATNDRGLKRSRSVKSSSRNAALIDEDVKKRYESFKQFDTVEGHSDHYYAKQNPAMEQPPKNWAKRIQYEWKILEKDLPDTIFVRVYESRMDLLRAVIIGAEGTPYHDGLFFFDVCFPSSYPNSPPLVHYHSGGERINPNLYNCGKVCLSLLNTWSGSHNEKWLPKKSTMLQVLVSIQGLILNMKPYFNEPGFSRSSGSAHGEMASIQYNENTLILSLKTMVNTMKKPPTHFEDLVVGHFQHRAHDILMACKAYTEGVQVGCLVKGGVQDVDENNQSCSSGFKHQVASYSKTLVSAFKKIGAKAAQEFLPLTVKESSLPAAPAGPSIHPGVSYPFPTHPGHSFAFPTHPAHGYAPSINPAQGLAPSTNPTYAFGGFGPLPHIKPWRKM